MVNQLLIGGKGWTRGFGFDLYDSRFPICRRIEAEIAAGREDSSGGFKGILGELTRSVACLSDPYLMQAISPPFDLVLDDLATSKVKAKLLLQTPAEYLQDWAPILKSTLVSLMLFKSRAPSAPRVTLVVDEAAQLGAFPELVKAFTYGAGAGLRPVGVWQSFDQLKAIAPNAQSIITASTQLKLIFAVRDLDFAQTVSQMLGKETLRYDDAAHQARARHAKSQALWSMLNGEDPVASMMRANHQSFMQEHQSSQPRDLRSPGEVLGQKPDRGYLFTDTIEYPVEFERPPYYRQKMMEGRYFPSPYHPPHDHVRVKRWWGTKRLWVHEAPVPETFKTFPQYAAGTWRFLSPERPKPCAPPSPSQPADPTFPDRGSLPMPTPVKLLPPPGPNDQPMKKL